MLISTRFLSTLAFVTITSALAQAQLVSTAFSSGYTVASIGLPPGFPPGQCSGLEIKPGAPDTLLIGLSGFSGQIYEAPIQRGPNGHIIGFSGVATPAFMAPESDGGLAFSPDGVMFVVTWPNNQLLQYLPGSTSPDLVTDLTPLGVVSSTGSCRFVPEGFAGAGNFKLTSTSGEWYDADLVQNASGTYDVAGVTATTITPAGATGISYVKGGNAGFTNDSVLITNFDVEGVNAFEIDANGDPIPSSKQNFLTDLEVAIGGTVDPVSGDFLCNSFFGVSFTGVGIIVASGFDQSTIYCEGKVNSNGCVPTIQFQGSPSLTGPDDYVLTGTNMLNNSFGILVWSTTPGIFSLGGGTLCLAGPFYRHPVQFSGGTAGAPGFDCSGTFADPLTQGWFSGNGLMSGTSVYLQYISRDGGFASPNNYSLSNGLRFTIRD